MYIYHLISIDLESSRSLNSPTHCTVTNTTIYIINMADPTAIKYSKCYIYKPRLIFIKDSSLKKFLKLYHLYPPINSGGQRSHVYTALLSLK